jgi:hypothetical protein
LKTNQKGSVYEVSKAAARSYAVVTSQCICISNWMVIQTLKDIDYRIYSSEHFTVRHLNNDEFRTYGRLMDAEI